MKLVEQFYRVLAPNDCLACQKEGSLLCEWCVDDALPEHDSRCYKCNKLTKFFAVCSTCRRKSDLKHVYIRTEYMGLSKELVHKMKFSYSVEAASIIGKELVNTLPVLEPETKIVYIPTITSHVRQRGFDHTKSIATALSLDAKLELVDVLVRTNQQRQVGSTRRQRVSQQAKAFRVRNRKYIKGMPILLVDDVITTGATLEAAAKILIENRAKSVNAVVFARSIL